MEPIISPWIFYLMSLADGLKIFSGIVAFCGAVVALGIYAFFGFERDEFAPWKYTKFPVIITIIGLIICLFVPSQEIMTKMIVASFITPDNIELGVEGIKSIFEYILTTTIEIIGK